MAELIIGLVCRLITGFFESACCVAFCLKEINEEFFTCIYFSHRKLTYIYKTSKKKKLIERKTFYQFFTFIYNTNRMFKKSLPGMQGRCPQKEFLKISSTCRILRQQQKLHKFHNLLPNTDLRDFEALLNYWLNMLAKL